MPERLKYLDKTEACYETEYVLRKDIHFQKGEILKLEHINAKHRRVIERLNERINSILEKTQDLINGDQIDHMIECTNLFEAIKCVIVLLSEKEGNQLVDPNEIDVKYIESAVRYTMPGLFSMYALLSEDDKHKIELADSILHWFGIDAMAKYEELIECGDIDIATIDHRVPC
jgi:uncharacterized coiled-coil protein SlyX